MPARRKVGFAAVAVAITVSLLGFASAASAPSTTAKPHARVAELKSVGGTGLKGLIYSGESGGLNFHYITLACSQACPTGAGPSGIPIRLKLASGRCNEGAGTSFSAAAGKLGRGGLNHKGWFHSSSGLLATVHSARVSWDPDGNGKFALAACGHIDDSLPPPPPPI